VVAAMILWNTVYLSRAIDDLKPARRADSYALGLAKEVHKPVKDPSDFPRNILLKLD
jgi:hypothetical protein